MAEPTTMSEQDNRCAKCDNPAHAMCGGCKDGLDTQGKPSPASYCSKECQSTHWQTHKSDCKASNHRKQLYRTGEAARRMFLDLREATFDIPIGKVVKKPGYLSIYEGPAGGSEVLIRIPEGTFESREDEEAMLAYGSDSKALSIMHKFVVSSLEGSCKLICEATMSGAGGKLRIACPNSDSRPKGHLAFRVELKDGNNYALDLTAAQFGLHQVVFPWDEYCNILDLKALTYFPCGKSESNDLKLHAVYKSRLAPGKPIPVSGEHYTNIIMIVQNNATSCLYSAINAWMTKHDQNVTKMIKLSEQQFKQELEVFTSFVKHHIDLFFAWVNTCGFKEVINTFKNVFEGYLKERMKEAKNPEVKNDEESVLKQKQTMEDDRLFELEKAFRNL